MNFSFWCNFFRCILILRIGIKVTGVLEITAYICFDFKFEDVLKIQKYYIYLKSKMKSSIFKQEYFQNWKSSKTKTDISHQASNKVDFFFGS